MQMTRTLFSRDTVEVWSADAPRAMTCTHEKNVASRNAYGAVYCLQIVVLGNNKSFPIAPFR